MGQNENCWRLCAYLDAHDPDTVILTEWPWCCWYRLDLQFWVDPVYPRGRGGSRERFGRAGRRAKPPPESPRPSPHRPRHPQNWQSSFRTAPPPPPPSGHTPPCPPTTA